MARQDALLRLHKTLLARRAQLRKRLGMDLEDLAHVKHSSASGDVADAAFDSSGEELASTLAELEAGGSPYADPRLAGEMRRALDSRKAAR